MISQVQALRRVLWLCGPPDAGKTTVGRILAERHSWHLHVLDETQARSVEDIVPEAEPALAMFLAMTDDERWATGPADRMAGWIIDIAREGLPRLIQGIQSRYRGEPVIVEGPWLFAQDIAPLLTTPSQAVWLMPTIEFKLASAERRDKPKVRHLTGDPELARDLWLERDGLLEAHIRQGCIEHELRMLPVDSSRAADEIAAEVGAVFLQHLSAVGRADTRP